MYRKTLYIPVLNFYFTKLFKEEYKQIKTNKLLNFLKKDSIIYHPYILLSYGLYGKYDNIIRENCKIENPKNSDVLVFGDSGGFQIVSGAIKNIEEEKVKIFNWLEKNCNYGMTLDIPYFISRKNFHERNEEVFNKSLQFSYETYKYFYEQKRTTKYLTVIHGRTIKQLEKWYDRMKEFDFKGGIAFGGISSKSFYFSLQSFFSLYQIGAYEKYKKNDGNLYLLHFLGVSDAEAIIYFSYMQRWLNKLGYNLTISYDSSYYATTAGKGNFFTDNHFLKNYIKTKMTNKNLEWKEQFNNIPAPFSSPFFQDLTFENTIRNIFTENKDDKFENSKSYFYSLLSLHNLYIHLNYYNFIDKLMQLGNYELFNYLFKDKIIIKKLQIIDKMFQSKNPIKILQENEKLFFSQASIYDPKNILF